MRGNAYRRFVKTLLILVAGALAAQSLPGAEVPREATYRSPIVRGDWSRLLQPCAYSLSTWQSSPVC